MVINEQFLYSFWINENTITPISIWSLVNLSHVSLFSFFKIHCDIFSCLCLSLSNGFVNYTAASTASTIDKISLDEIPKITRNVVWKICLLQSSVFVLREWRILCKEKSVACRVLQNLSFKQWCSMKSSILLKYNTMLDWYIIMVELHLSGCWLSKSPIVCIGLALRVSLSRILHT